MPRPHYPCWRPLRRQQQFLLVDGTWRGCDAPPSRVQYWWFRGTAHPAEDASGAPQCTIIAAIREGPVSALQLRLPASMAPQHLAQLLGKRLGTRKDYVFLLLPGALMHHSPAGEVRPSSGSGPTLGAVGSGEGAGDQSSIR